MIVHHLDFGAGNRPPGGNHAGGWPAGLRRAGHPLHLHRLAVDLVDGHRRVHPALADGKGILGHGVAGHQGRGLEAVRLEALQEGGMALIAHRLGAVDQPAPAGKVDPFQVARANLLGAEIVGKIRQPGQRAPVARNGLQQAHRRTHPIEGRHQHQRIAGQNRHQEAGNQAHVVVQRQPGNDHVLRVEMQGLFVGLHLVEHRAVRQRHPLLQAGGAGGMLQQDNIFRRALHAAQRGEIRLGRRIHLPGDNHLPHRGAILPARRTLPARIPGR